MPVNQDALFFFDMFFYEIGYFLFGTWFLKCLIFKFTYTAYAYMTKDFFDVIHVVAFLVCEEFTVKAVDNFLTTLKSKLNLT